ncbi:MAG: DNA-binding protein [Burkholderiaceae bacterium]|nr:DNA-binding protein [Burkholderiaceae bacterium]
MPRGITENDVWTACDALLVSGSRPTIERVRHHLGRGSPNTVGPHLDTWFKGLGARIQDPAAFAAPSGVPDPVHAAASQLWEVAQAEARRDTEQRVTQGMAEAEARALASETRAQQSEAALQASAMAAQRAQEELTRAAGALEEALRNHAAEKARVDEVRTALAATHLRIQQLEAELASQRAEAAQQVAAALERADAADRRVAMELERERSARAKAERAVEGWAAKADAARRETVTATDELQRKLDAAHMREMQLQAQLASATADLALERTLRQDAQGAAQAQEANARAARDQTSMLHETLERLTATLATSRSSPPKSAVPRKRSARKAV